MTKRSKLKRFIVVSCTCTAFVAICWMPFSLFSFSPPTNFLLFI